MRGLMLAAAVAAVPGVVWADGVEVVHCATVTGNTVIQCPANLTKGQDYLVRVGGDESDGFVQLINPAGQATITLQSGYDVSGHQEFRAAYSAIYQLRITSRDSGPDVDGWIFSDCRSDAKTQCTLPAKGQRQGMDATKFDSDWYRTAVLIKGVLYTFTLTGDRYTRMALRDATGQVLAKTHIPGSGVIQYRARATGPCFVDVAGGFNYTVAVQ